MQIYSYKSVQSSYGKQNKFSIADVLLNYAGKQQAGNINLWMTKIYENISTQICTKRRYSKKVVFCRVMPTSDGHWAAWPRSVTCWHLAYYSIYVYATLQYVYAPFHITPYMYMQHWILCLPCTNWEHTVNTYLSDVHVNDRYTALGLGLLYHICRCATFGLMCAHTSIIGDEPS